MEVQPRKGAWHLPGIDGSLWVKSDHSAEPAWAKEDRGHTRSYEDLGLISKAGVLGRRTACRPTYLKWNHRLSCGAWMGKGSERLWEARKELADQARRDMERSWGIQAMFIAYKEIYIHTGGGHVKWCSCYGKRYGVSSKIKHRITVTSSISTSR